LSGPVLRARWLGRVAYGDALALQHGLWGGGSDTGPADDWLLLLEHPHVYTLGVRADPSHVLVDPATVGAELVRADRGGDVTYHGPGQLVGYPIRSVVMGSAAVPNHAHQVEQILIDALATLGLPGAGRLEGYPGVWVGVDAGRPRKIAAIGIRLARGRSMHGFALNVDPDLAYFGNIVPCGIADKPVTSLAAEGVQVPMRAVVDAVVDAATRRWSYRTVDRQDVAWRLRSSDVSAFTRDPAPSVADLGRSGDGPGPQRPAAAPAAAQPVRLFGRLAEAGVDPDAGLSVSERKPAWLRVPARMGEEYRALRATVRSLDLVTVCEEAGCPNIYECWADGTATFMVNGDRCTRACGFCLVDTRKPLPPDPGEPARVADAVARLGLAHAVVTTVARDDLDDDGAGTLAATVAAIRERCPETAVELLISDCRGHDASLEAIFDARPDVLNHNLETVARLQRAVRPSASYARSLSVLARAKAAGLVTKSGLMVGLGEGPSEVVAALADLHGVGVDIVTVGQYLRPTARHLPVARWWTPEEFAGLRAVGEGLGIPHVEASPLTRSSYHARAAAAGLTPVAAS
jgi:lipoic acid synthetase